MKVLIEKQSQIKEERKGCHHHLRQKKTSENLIFLLERVRTDQKVKQFMSRGASKKDGCSLPQEAIDGHFFKRKNRAHS